MKNRLILLGLGLCAFLYIISCTTQPTSADSTTSEASTVGVEDRLNYPDFGFMPSPKDYHGRAFRLSDDFPTEEPAVDAGVQAIYAIDFKTDWEAYALAVRDYIFEGNASTDYPNAFYLEDNEVRDWYHVPWQHWGPTGREGVHGLTQEGPIAVGMLAPEQKSFTHAYAVGFYNDLGGYTIGKVWNGPVPNYTSLRSEGFPEGTVVGKLLFVPLSSNEVPYLANPIGWDAYVYASDLPGNTDTTGARTLASVNLIQMDIMVKDPRAESTGGWVFGTFVYNGNLGNENRWENMMPVGLMWGNDPENRMSNYNPTPTQTVINTNLTETVINDSPEMPPMHLGFNSRLNGPLDNPYSSCMSCHSTAQYPVVTGILPQFNDPKVPIPEKGSEASSEWMRWFRNVPCGTPFDEGKAVSFDYSLQLVKSIQNYIEYASAAQAGLFHEDYWSDGNKIRRNLVMQ